jgi:hypothetical protein
MITTASLWGQLRDLVNNDVYIVTNAGTPTSGTSGTGVGITGPGSILFDTTNKVAYLNTNTKASPTWTLIAQSGGAGNFSAGSLILPQSTSILPTAEGSVGWDTDDNLLKVGDGSGTKTMVDLTSTQTLTNKTLTSPVLTTPTLGVASATSLAAAGLIKSSAPSGGVGYATGAGGAVTQITSKATTTVASPNPSLCGAITTAADALGADTIVSFTFTNSGIAATDVLILNHISGGTVGKYHLNAQCGNGSAVINITNISAGSLSEAIVIQYAVVKGVNA